jgi:hypothetical protein
MTARIPQLKPYRQPDPRPPRGTGDFANLVVARFDVPCTCGGGRLEVRTGLRGRPVATVTNASGCPLGEVIADQPSVVANTEGGGGARREPATHPRTHLLSLSILHQRFPEAG